MCGYKGWMKKLNIKQITIITEIWFKSSLSGIISGCKIEPICQEKWTYNSKCTVIYNFQSLFSKSNGTLPLPLFSSVPSLILFLFDPVPTHPPLRLEDQTFWLRHFMELNHYYSINKKKYVIFFVFEIEKDDLF